MRCVTTVCCGFAGAKDALTALHGSGKVRLVLVTSRQTAIQEETKQWLDKHFSGLFDEVVFGNHYGRSGAKRYATMACAYGRYM